MLKATEYNQVYVVYDKQCPMCDNYCQMVRLKQAAGEVQLIDARQPSDIMDEITALDWDIDQGMVVKVNDNYYYGSDAIHVLALMTQKVGIFNRLSCLVFGYRPVAKVMYPILRSCRNVVLKLLGVGKINNLNIKDNDKF